ncbi:MAG: ABC transporter substrate-binding protein [Chloroflexi bacterium]|nr:ABC transporter substrate-binding protein [Chloroflexota bacterium]
MDSHDTASYPDRAPVSRRSFLKGAFAAGLAPVAVTVLAACSPAPAPATATSAATSAPAKPAVAPATSATSAPAAVAPPGGAQEITFWHSFGGDLGKKLEAYVDQYNASQKAVKVAAEFAAPSYVELLQKLLPAIAAGTGPDVVLTGTVAELAKANTLQPLDALIQTAKIDLTDFNQGLLEDCKYKGALYGLPFARSTPVLYYDEELFGEASVDAKAFLSNWDNFMTQGPKLVKKQGAETTQFAYSAPPAWWFWSQKVFAFGGEMSDAEGNVLFDQPAGVEALQFWQDLIHKQGVAKSYPAGVGFEAWTASSTDWLNKRSVVSAESTAQLTNYLTNAKFKSSAAPLPAMKTRGVPTGGSNLMMLAASKKQEAAMDFMGWLTSTDGTAGWHIVSGYLPVRTSAQQSQKLQDWFVKSPAHKVAVDQLQVARPTPVVTQMAKFDTQVTRTLLERVLLQKADVKIELQKAASDTASLWKEFTA